LARRRIPIFPLLGALTVLAGAGAAAWIVWEQSNPGVRAPTERGVCWRMTAGADAPVFTAVGRGTENLESCAATLEALHLSLGQRVIQGAYQGRFIFVNRNAILTAESLEGPRWPIFQGELRQRLRNRIQAAEQREAAGLPPLPSGL